MKTVLDGILQKGMSGTALQFEYRQDILDKLLATGLRVPEKLHKAVLKRKLEYMAGRSCVQEAFRLRDTHGVPQLGTNQSGAPIWPDGWTGSISHCNGQAACVIAESAAYAGIGLDLERIVTAECVSEISPAVLTAKDILFLTSSVEHNRKFLTLCFSAKESLYKAISSKVGFFFDFQVADMDVIDWDNNRFQLSLNIDLTSDFSAGTQFAGRFFVTDEIIGTLIAVAA